MTGTFHGHQRLDLLPCKWHQKTKRDAAKMLEWMCCAPSQKWLQLNLPPSLRMVSKPHIQVGGATAEAIVISDTRHIQIGGEASCSYCHGRLQQPQIQGQGNQTRSPQAPKRGDADRKLQGNRQVKWTAAGWVLPISLDSHTHAGAGAIRMEDP